jgi:hypothetical protein
MHVTFLSEILKGIDHLGDLGIFTRVRKLITNRSKTAVMDVIGFIFVSLGSSTVQLHDSLGSRRACACSGAGFHSQIDDGA